MTGGYKLLIVLLLSFWGSHSMAQEYDFSINWKADEAAAISVLNQQVPNLNIRLAGKEQKIAGSLAVDTNSQFTPYFPFAIGATYKAYAGSQYLFEFTPQKSVDNPVVENIFPLADKVPENFLKFYIEFDQPMAKGHVYDHLHLLRGGQEIENAFIPLKPELWNSDKTVVTVWIDPGRIKRDLEPNKKFGAVLEAGNTYELVVTEGLKAANGADLYTPYVKTFQVIERDERSPSVNNWSLEVPAINSAEALLINTQEAMDYSSHGFLGIFLNGAEVEGDYTFISDTEISFLPKKEWKAGAYVLKIAAKAEDLAGNNFNRPFDLDLKKDIAVGELEHYEIIFKVKKED